MPRRTGKPSSARWVVLGLVASGIAAIGAYGASPNSRLVGDRVGSAAGWGSRPALPDPCSNRSALNGVNPEQSRTICLTAGADKTTVPGGKGHPAIAVYGLGGNDQITATNGGAHIYGGPGTDTAYVLNERYAKWADTEHVIDKSGRTIQGLRRSSAASPTTFTPPKTPPREVRPLDPSVRCAKFSDGRFKVRFGTAPILRAFNTIADKLEFQDVAYAAGLDRWDATRKVWVRVQTSPWYWDETYDRDWSTFPVSGNFWRTYDTLLQPSVFPFTIAATDTGYYRIILAYHWYAAEQGPYNGQTVDFPDYDWSQWVPTHYDQSNDRTAGFAKDKYCTFGVDPAGGP